MTDALSVVVAVGLSAFSWFAGMSTAGGQQDREQIRKQRGVARALLADLDRIEAAFGRGGIPSIHLVEIARGVRTQVPSIHPWIESIIPQIADSSAEVVARLMELQAALDMARSCAASLELQYASIGLLGTELEELEPEGRTVEFDGGKLFIQAATQRQNTPTNPIAKMDWDERLSGRKEKQSELEGRLAEVRSELPALQDLLLGADAAVHDRIARLRALLSPIANAPIPSLPSLIFQRLFPIPGDPSAADTGQ